MNNTRGAWGESRASVSDAGSSCSSHPAIKPLLSRMLWVMHGGVYFFLKLLDVFYTCLGDHGRKREGGRMKDGVHSRIMVESGRVWHWRSARSSV